MPILLNHTIIASRDRHKAAAFLVDLFGLAEPVAWGPFVTVALDQDMLLQYAEPPVDEIQMQHYAFLVDDSSFDRILERLEAAGIPHWADPQMTLPNQINTNHGGRGVYFFDPSGHGMEVLTRPYGAAA